MQTLSRSLKVDLRHPALFLFGAFLAAIPLHDACGQQPAEWRTDFRRHTVPLSEIVSGGPPKDGIPALSRPRLESVASADRWLAPREPVMVVEHDGVARGYPLQILIWHEIVNDNLGNLPIAVTFCPLCNTALVFDRRHNGRVLEFGTTGRLRHSDLVMYDKLTESWWQQATGEAIVGVMAGDALTLFESQTMAWADFKRAYPAAQVLSRKTGYDRPYGTNPYKGYDAPGGSPLAAFFKSKTDARLPAMERVVALRLEREAVAYPFSRLRSARVINDMIARRPIAVFWAPGTASALDRTDMASGRDVGATGVFDRRLANRTLTFESAQGGGFRDRETGTRWDLLGNGLTGPLRGRRLVRIPYGDFFWFAWAVFRPDTRIGR